VWRAVVKNRLQDEAASSLQAGVLPVGMRLNRAVIHIAFVQLNVFLNPNVAKAGGLLPSFFCNAGVNTVS
jgi:hypothetical protein